MYIYLALKKDKAESIDREIYKAPHKAIAGGSGVYEMVVSDKDTPNNNDV